MAIRGIRGAISVNGDLAAEILNATQELLMAIISENPGLSPEDVASVIFTMTDDLCAAYPAQAARTLGWDRVPLLCAQEIPVPGSLPLCIRVLIHWNTELPQQSIQHVYLGAAVKLRPDLAAE